MMLACGIVSSTAASGLETTSAGGVEENAMFFVNYLILVVR